MSRSKFLFSSIKKQTDNYFYKSQASSNRNLFLHSRLQRTGFLLSSYCNFSNLTLVSFSDSGYATVNEPGFCVYYFFLTSGNWTYHQLLFFKFF